MKIKTTKKQRLLIEYDLDMLKLSHCSDVFASQVEYKSVQVKKDRVSAVDINSLVKELGCNVTSCEVLIFLSRSLFLNRYLTLPTTNDDEIEKMLSFQLTKLIPYSMEEIIYDYKVLNKAENSSSLLVLILQKQKLDILNNFLIKNNKVAQYTGLSTELLLSDYKDQILDSDNECLVFVNDGRAEFVCYDEQINFMRSFKYKDDDSMQMHLEQTQQLLQKEFPQVDAEQLIMAKPVKREYSNLNDYEFEYDFSSLATQRLHKKRVFRKLAVNSVVIALELFIIFSLFAYKTDLIKKRQISFLKSKVKTMKSSLGDSTVVLDKLAVLETLQQGRGVFSVLLSDIVSLLPNRTVISALNIDNNNSFVIKGYAPNMDTIFKYVLALNNKENFAQVSAQNVSKVRQKNSNRVEFSIDGKWLEQVGGNDA